MLDKILKYGFFLRLYLLTKDRISKWFIYLLLVLFILYGHSEVVALSNLIDDKQALKVFKEIAELIGIPNFISSQFTELPKQSRTNGGRDGWLLDNTIPNILLLTSPFKSNDIIVTIDGISANNINKLKQHLSKKNNNNFFDVEIQRSGNLKMIRVRL